MAERRCEATDLTAGKECVGGQLFREGAPGQGGSGVGEEGCAGDIGESPSQPGRLSNGPGKLLEAASRMWGESWAAGVSSLKEPSSPAQRWVAESSRSQPGARHSCQLAAFAGPRCGLVAFSLSQASQLQAFQRNQRSSSAPWGHMEALM